MNNEPNLFGLNFTIYYHLFTQKYFITRHEKRSSAFNTLIKTSALKDFEWCEDSNIWTDIYLWKKLKGITSDSEIISLGIKHGLGVYGGRGHERDLNMYREQDGNYKYLKSIVREDIEFYKSIIETGLP
jgi:hypothetical protein